MIVCEICKTPAPMRKEMKGWKGFRIREYWNGSMCGGSCKPFYFCPQHRITADELREACIERVKLEGPAAHQAQIGRNAETSAEAQAAGQETYRPVSPKTLE